MNIAKETIIAQECVNGPFVLVRMHDVSRLSIAELRGLIGNQRKEFDVIDDEPIVSDSRTGKLKPQQGICRK